MKVTTKYDKLFISDFFQLLNKSILKAFFRVLFFKRKGREKWPLLLLNKYNFFSRPFLLKKRT